MSVIVIGFYGVLALIVMGTALGMLLSRNAVYSALFLVLNFGAVAVLYVSLGAPFIALAQVEVYAGAIMVLFLFVIMLLGAERMAGTEVIPGQRFLAFVLGGIFLAELAVVVVWLGGGSHLVSAPRTDFANPVDLGVTLFSSYALPFEITSIILLVAAVGAILLTRGEVSTVRRQIGDKREEEAGE